MIWSHPGTLSAAQWEQVRLHPDYGERILSRTTGLETVARLAGCDHERADASGYYRGSSNGLAPGAGILAVADAYQAMTPSRPVAR